jgi:hypothetical protein
MQEHQTIQNDQLNNAAGEVDLSWYFLCLE